MEETERAETEKLGDKPSCGAGESALSASCSILGAPRNT